MKTLSAAVGLIVAVALLVPLIVAGGLIALVALPPLSITRRMRAHAVAHPREPGAVVLALGPAQAEPGLDVHAA